MVEKSTFGGGLASFYTLGANIDEGVRGSLIDEIDEWSGGAILTNGQGVSNGTLGTLAGVWSFDDLDLSWDVDLDLVWDVDLDLSWSFDDDVCLCCGRGLYSQGGDRLNGEKTVIAR